MYINRYWGIRNIMVLKIFTRIVIVIGCQELEDLKISKVFCIEQVRTTYSQMVLRDSTPPNSILNWCSGKFSKTCLLKVVRRLTLLALWASPNSKHFVQMIVAPPG